MGNSDLKKRFNHYKGYMAKILFTFFRSLMYVGYNDQKSVIKYNYYEI